MLFDPVKSQDIVP